EELSSKLAATQQAAGESKRQSEDQENRLREGMEQLEHTKSELEQQDAERARLESELGDQLKATKAAAEKAEGACREEAQRSKRFEGEWASLQQQREELSGKLAAEQQAAGQSRRWTEELEKQLSERNHQVEHAKTGLEQHATAPARLESELGEQLEVAKAAAEKAEAAAAKAESACREEAKRSKQFEEELDGQQKQGEELSGKLATAQQAAGESKRRREELEKRLRESTGETERAKTERARLESELGGHLKAAKAAAEKAEAAAAKAEAACREEAKRSKQFEEERGNLQKQGEELSGRLAAAQQAAGESKRRSE